MESARKNLVEPKQFMNKILFRHGEKGRSACEIMAAAINAVDPYQIIKQNVRSTQERLFVGEETIRLADVDRIFLIGFGKAAVPMAKAFLDILGGEITIAEVVTKSEIFLEDMNYKNKLKVHIGGHPIPSAASIRATRAILDNFGALSAKDLVLVLISGGGSALFTDPISGISLEALIEMTNILLKSGADIHEINTLRKHLDRVKGGRLARRLHPARVHSFILSDVIGDRLDMIASGPTVPDPTTFHDALKIIEKYDLRQALPKHIIKILENGHAGAEEETLKSSDFQKIKVRNHLVGTNIKAALAAKQKAEELGYNSVILTSHLVGRTCDVADFLFSIIQSEVEHDHPIKKPACLILGGETTVEIKGEGKGGRNQDLVLHMVQKISDKEGVLFISLATDGEDGPTDAAGAVVDAKVYLEGTEMLGLSIETFIDTNNSYNYFQKLGGLIKIGSTGTNVNDLVLILIVRSENT